MDMRQGNIENFSGVAQVPIGFAGPLLINGEHPKGEFFVPLATSLKESCQNELINYRLTDQARTYRKKHGRLLLSKSHTPGKAGAM